MTFTICFRMVIRPRICRGEDSLLYPVYLAEQRATGALLAYYRTVMTGSFEKSLEAIKEFTRQDAAICSRRLDEPELIRRMKSSRTFRTILYRCAKTLDRPVVRISKKRLYLLQERRMS